jgi:hypothetical protein
MCLCAGICHIAAGFTIAVQFGVCTCDQPAGKSGIGGYRPSIGRFPFSTGLAPPVNWGSLPDLQRLTKPGLAPEHRCRHNRFG